MLPLGCVGLDKESKFDLMTGQETLEEQGLQSYVLRNRLSVQWSLFYQHYVDNCGHWIDHLPFSSCPRGFRMTPT